MNGIEKLYATAMDRKANPEEGSYTSYLFSKGLDKILKKVGEECTEVVIASLHDDPKATVEELADLAYHISVLMAEKGITPAMVQAELDRRAKKQHNLKAERKPVEQY